MSDQERPAPGYECSLPQKAANLDSKVPVQRTHNCSPKPSDATTGGYYLNVAQKGKLILPTALWILLMIAGVSFITLLATLNKSINTLETLVELEQEKETLSISDHFQRPKFGRQSERYFKKSTAKPKKGAKKHQHQHESKQLPEQTDVIQIIDLNNAQPDGNWLLPIEPSWFAMPSWTSLEPVRQQRPMPLMGLLDEMMRGAPAVPDSIIVHEGPMEESPMGLLNSFTKQLAPVFDRLMPSASGDLSGTLRISDQAGSPATISAKIDNLNVHINPEKPVSREDEVNSLEKSIDQLVDKLLMGPSPLMPPKALAQRRPHAKRPHEPQLGPMLAPLAELLPFQRPQSGPDAMFVEISTDDGPQALEQNTLKKFAAPADELPDEGQLVISISGALEPGKPSGETNRHHVSNTRRPSAGHSPYEQLSPFPADIILFNPLEVKPEHRPMASPAHHRRRPDHHIVKPGKPAETPWELLANELAEGLVEDALKQQNKQPNHFGRPDEPQFIIINDAGPLVIGEQPNIMPTIFRPETLMPPFEVPAPDGVHKLTRKPSPVDDMLNVLLAPTKGSELMSGEPKQPHEMAATQSASSIPKVDSSTLLSSSEPTTTKAAPTDVAAGANSSPAPSEMNLTMSSMEPTMSPEAKKEVDSIISQLPKQSSTLPDDADHKSADKFLQDFMRPLFSLPQMSGGQQSASTDGSRPSAGSSDVVTVPTSAPTITTTNSPVSATQIPKATNATTPSGQSRVDSIFSKLIGFFRDPPPASQAEATPASATTTPTLKEDATKLTSVANAPIVELIEEQELLDQLPAIDLSPFAKSSKLFDRALEKSKELAAVSTNPTSSKPHPSAGGPKEDATSNLNTTTAKPRLVTVSEADLEAETQRSKSFLEKANDVLERQVLGLKRFLNADKP